MITRKIKVAVVGFGFMGKTHALNILENKDLQLVAIVDKEPETITRNLLGENGNFFTGNIDPVILKNIHTYTSLDECLLYEEIDAVHVCVHTDLHYELTKKALSQNKHVLLEKPFCLNTVQAQELINLAEEKKRLLMVGHVVRFMPPYQKLKEWVDSEEFGKLQFLSFSRFSGTPGWGQWKDKNVISTSGGALFDLVIHDIDFANYVLGLPSDIKCQYLPGRLSKHDFISALWSYSDKNVYVKIEGGNTFHVNFPFQAGFMAQFEKASILYTSLKAGVIQIANDTAIWEVASGDAGAGYYNEISYFANCLMADTKPYDCMPTSSLQSIQLCYSHL